MLADPKSQEKIEAIKGDNKVNDICHWKEALDLTVIGGHREALILMIKLAEGTPLMETWGHAVSTAAKEGKDERLAMLLDHKEPSEKESQKATDKGKTANRKDPNISQKAITKNNPVGQQDLRSKNTIAV